MPTWAKWLLGCGCAAFLVAALVAVGVVMFVSSRPRAWHVEPSVEIAASPAEILPLLADLRRWPEWSAWSRDVDEGVEREFSGAQSGAGSVLTWSPPLAVGVRAGGLEIEYDSDSSLDVGSGTVEILAVAGDGVTLRTTHVDGLVFAQTTTSGAGSSTSRFKLSELGRSFVISGAIRLEASATGTRVTWSEDGDFGDGVLQAFLAAGALEMVRVGHSEVLAASLARLKSHFEQPK